MRSWPAWLATFLGAVALVLGLVLNFNIAVTNAAATRWFNLVGPLLLGGSILLAAGLHSLQASYDAWCDCAECAGGCGCCDDGCSCGDCDDCMPGRGGHEGHGHDGGHEHHEHD